MEMMGYIASLLIGISLGLIGGGGLYSHRSRYGLSLAKIVKGSE